MTRRILRRRWCTGRSSGCRREDIDGGRGYGESAPGLIGGVGLEVV